MIDKTLAEIVPHRESNLKNISTTIFWKTDSFFTEKAK